MGIRLHKDWPFYALFQYLWILVILPKALQLLALGALMLLMWFRSGKEKPLDAFTLLQGFYLLVYGVSIAVNTLIAKHETSRIFAAVNTWTVTLISVILYHIYSHVQLDLQRLSKYMFINVCILFGVYVLYELLDYRGNFSFMPHALAISDWVNDAPAVRFTAYMEYSNLVVYFMLFCFPLSLLYVQQRFGKLVLAGYAVLCILPVLATNSRMGMLVMPVLAAVSIVFVFWNDLLKLYQKHGKLVWIGGLLLLAVALVVLWKPILGFVERFLSARQGSTDTRFGIYLSSLERVFTESPIIGCGIKDMLGYYPYGSHSTYIGVIYKAGVLGGCIYLISIIWMAVRSIRHKPANAVQGVLLVSFLLTLVISSLEDLDGANWCIAMFLALYSVCYGKNTSCKPEGADL